MAWMVYDYPDPPPEADTPCPVCPVCGKEYDWLVYSDWLNAPVGCSECTRKKEPWEARDDGE